MTLDQPRSHHADRGSPVMGDDRQRVAEWPGSRDRLVLHALTYVAVNLLLVAGWIVSEAAFFWPIVPAFGWGICLVLHTWLVLWPRLRAHDEFDDAVR